MCRVLNWMIFFVALTLVVSLSLFTAIGQQQQCSKCRWDCTSADPNTGIDTAPNCQKNGGQAVCRRTQDQWGNWDECEHAPPTLPGHEPTGGTPDTWVGQCIPCNLPCDTWEMALHQWREVREYACGMKCVSWIPTLKDRPEPAWICPEM